MTSFVAWIGVDSHGPASLYFAGDSRISWSHETRWDCGRKVFASRVTPDIFGYVGDVLFPSLVLGQLCSQLDAGLLRSSGESAADVWDRVVVAIRATFDEYPAAHRRPFTIVYGSRDGAKTGCAFRVWTLDWSETSRWTQTIVALPAQSGPLTVLGSGTREVERWRSYWDSTNQQRTSRSIFSAFCDSLAHGADSQSGGAPQLVGLYRIRAAMTLGVIFKGSAYVAGMPITEIRDSTIEWRNHLFERVTLQGRRVSGAQEHRAPKGLGLSGE